MSAARRAFFGTDSGTGANAGADTMNAPMAPGGLHA